MFQAVRVFSRQEENATKILLCVVLVFLILHIPRVAYKCMNFLGNRNVDSWYWVIPVSRLALTINSSVNFVIYSLVGRNFRDELISIFKSKNTLVSKTNSNGGGEVLSLEKF